MPYTPRQYNLIPLPQGPDPIQTLTGLMYAGRQMQAMGEEARAAKQQKTREQAFTTAKGDPHAAAELLTKAGDFDGAKYFRAEADAIRQRTLAGVSQRLAGLSEVYDRAPQMLKELQADPTLYPQMAPQLRQMANAVDPRLGQEIPDTYDPERVNGMLQFVEKASSQNAALRRSAETLEAAWKASENALERRKKFRVGAIEGLLAAEGPDDWNLIRDNLQSGAGVPRDILDELGEWDDKVPDRLRRLLMTPEQQAAADRAGVDDRRQAASADETVRHNRAMEGIGRQREARLSTQDRTTATPTGKATAERWKAEQLDRLEAEFNLGDLDESVLRRRQLAIENSYRAQIGVKPLAALPAEWGTVSSPPATDPSAARPERRPIPGVPGGEAELRDGRWIRVK